MVYYRKYRPQKIEELDSREVRDLLYSVLSAKDIAHAFLFTGPKGLGKTSTARIVAKAVNCEEKSKVKSQKSKLQLKTQKLDNEETKDQRLKTKDQIEPCNRCHQCVSITNGTNIDVLEIDGASNRGIDEIRDLREKVKLSPARASKKVYIIDEVHMLTTEAFNALLKTLEEPPSHVIFILCTTEPHKVPATIASRCFHIAFKKATINELVRSFQRIAEKEDLTINDDALNFIASLSEGSFRDGVKILEEMAIVSPDQLITKEIVEEKYQIRQLTDQISEMLEFLGKKDTKAGLKLAGQLLEQGVDMKYFIEQLINTLHSFLLHKVGVEGIEEFSIFNFQFSIEETKELVELLTWAYGDLKYAVLPQLPLELAIIEWGVQKTQIIRESDSQKVSPSTEGSDSPKVRHSDSPSFPSVPKDNFWQALINRVKSYNHSIAGVLRGCSLKSYDNKEIVIETGYKFHKERLEEKKTMEILEKVCKEIRGAKVDVSVILKGGE